MSSCRVELCLFTKRHQNQEHFSHVLLIIETGPHHIAVIAVLYRASAEPDQLDQGQWHHGWANQFTLIPGSALAILTATTTAGTPIQGQEAINVVKQ
jgi:hypothetical protein